MNAAQPAIWKCLLTGGLAGFVNGFFGAGGGMIVVPLLILLVKLEDKNAFSSAISIILPLTIVSLVIYAKNGVLDVNAALPYLLGGAGGGILRLAAGPVRGRGGTTPHHGGHPPGGHGAAPGPAGGHKIGRERLRVPSGRGYVRPSAGAAAVASIAAAAAGSGSAAAAAEHQQ